MSKTKEEDFPLAGYTDQLAERLRTLVSAALHDGDVDAIHQARVTTRRLRAAIDLLRPVIPPKARKPVSKTLKRLRKQLGPLRDADVMLAHLDDLKRYSRHAAAINWLEKQIQIQRDQAVKEALSDAPPAKTLAKLGSWWGVREQIATAREQVDLLLAHSLHRQLDDFTAAADPLVNQSDNTMPAANPHAIRIAGKLLRYTVEMAEVEGHELPKTVLRSFKKMQEALGTWHDFVVFTETAMEISVQQILPATDAAMQQRVLDLCALAIRRAQNYLAKFIDLWKTRGGEISNAIRAAFPDPREVIEPKADPDPPGSTESPAPAVSDAAHPAAF